MHASVEHLQRDKRFATLIKKHGPPDLKRPSTTLGTSKGNVFRALCRAIVYQQLSGKAAATIFARFIALFPGKPFPTPEDLCKISVKKLRSAGLSAQKASYLKDLAQKFSDGSIKYRAFGKMTSDEIVEHLTQIKGIGTWTAHMLLLFTLNRPDILPTGDLGIRKGFQVVYGLRELPDHARMEKLAKPWRPHASAASWYLWRAADELKPKRQSDR